MDEEVKNYVRGTLKIVRRSRRESFGFEVLSSLELPYLSTGLSCNFKNGVKCCFGGFDVLRMVCCDDNMKFNQMYSVRKSEIVNKVMWIPDHFRKYPEILLVACQDLWLYECEDMKLIPRWRAGFGNKINPIVNFDWSYWDPSYISTIQKNGDCVLWSMEKEQEIFRLPSEFLYKPKLKIGSHNNSNCHMGLCFCRNVLNNCLITYGENTSNFMHDMRCPTGKYALTFREPILDIKCSFCNPWHVAYFFRNKVLVIDVRRPEEQKYKFKKFPCDVGTCISWSPFKDEIAIGTSSGRCIFWDLERNEYLSIFHDRINFIKKVTYHHSKEVLFINC
ncbi:uncharacterized protein [Centruroides vittatus]|uniref:uncharacterized protein n=1 Tax=Centruroides vittatus TaxID=120091 RepID=UPI0035109E4C